MKASDEPIVVEQTFHAPAEVVWSAITEADQMRQWFFDTIQTFQSTVGFETQFTVHVEGRDYVHLWKVTDVVPQKKITYNWKYEGFAGDSFVTFELFEQNGSTRLRLSHQATESFEEGIEDFSRDKGVEGWTYFIQQSLKAYLDKHSRA